ncbi:MAG TPA: phospholipase D-like domain-containing protein [Candidatus Limnocylindrales bacterium]|nr:phospholipase D-like domain-containing protein [Candidatus Limnocylindrales bacterium]
MDNNISVHAVSGTYVVLLGIDMKQADTTGLLGFAIRRADPVENEDYWLQGMRTFEASYPNPPDGALVSTRDHPVQDFLWSDFTAKPGRKYTYTIVPVTGKPKKLLHGAGVSIEVETESESDGEHAIYFNRGVIGSQAYARNWQAAPNKLSPIEKEKALDWLSRGLDEAVMAHIAKAKDESYGLRAAVYEFDYEPVIEAFQKAHASCRNVQIVYDARVSKNKQGIPDPEEKKRVAHVEELLDEYGLTDVATPRRASPSYIAHNKFIVLLKDGAPIEVWTGSTNFTMSGIFGQSNVGHLVRDPDIAAKYLAYWETLQKDPESDPLKDSNELATPTLTDFPPEKGTTPLFSPRHGLAQLNWYGVAMAGATSAMCFTGAFGINKVFLDDFEKDKDYLRYVFLEKWGTTAKTSQETEKALSDDFDIQVAIGATLPGEAISHWLAEQSNTISRNIKYTHTKFMLIDPLSDDPIVITGSANFSDASTSQNDENMLVIRGDLRVADVYLGEFMRLWRHHNFRYIVTTVDEGTGEPKHNYLRPNDTWAADFYAPTKIKTKRRKMFA